MAFRRTLLNRRLINCSMAAEPRFRTWSFISAAGELFHADYTAAICLLERADRLLGKNMSLEINEPYIAEDFGGEEQLWAIRMMMREVVRQLKSGNTEEAAAKLGELDGSLFGHATKRFAECLLAIIKPGFGVA